MKNPGRPKGVKNTKKYSEWTFKEEREFKKIYYSMTNVELCNHFNKSRSAVKSKATEFRLIKLGSQEEFDVDTLPESKSGIYFIKCKFNDMIYIGYSDNLKKRLNTHFTYLKSNNKENNKRLQSDWDQGYTFVYSFEYMKVEDAFIKEQLYLNGLDQTKLYNQNKQIVNPPKLSQAKINYFWSRINKKGDDECWLWTSTQRKGYGSIAINKRHYASHRLAYFLHYGIWPVGKVVRHKCDNQLCCNPHHLELGTDKDNARDCVQRGRKHIQTSRFTQIDINRMIELRKTHMRYKDIAEEFGVSDGYIATILTKQCNLFNDFIGDFDTTQYAAIQPNFIGPRLPPKKPKRQPTKKQLLQNWCKKCLFENKTWKLLDLYEQYCNEVEKPAKYSTFRVYMDQEYQVVMDMRGFFLTVSK